MKGLNEDFIGSILSQIYPIGRGFIDFTDTDYSNYLGFTWERELVGMFPIGYDANDEDLNEIGKTGGEAMHTLTIAEMPKHNHVYTVQNQEMYANQYAMSVSTKGNGWLPVSDAGGNEAHNNMPPYQVVAYWKRTA